MANTFSRPISLCGLTQQEAADHLGIAKRTVAMKATDMRKPTEAEIYALARLWARISRGHLDEDDQLGAYERRTAIEEVRKILAGDNPADDDTNGP